MPTNSKDSSQYIAIELLHKVLCQHIFASPFSGAWKQKHSTENLYTTFQHFAHLQKVFYKKLKSLVLLYDSIP